MLRFGVRMESSKLFSEASPESPSEGRPTDATIETSYSTGILPAQDLLKAIEVKEIQSVEEITDDQIQPASIDLRLGSKVYRVRASFLPGPKATVHENLGEFSMHEMDITNGGVLERGCVYIIPLMEHLSLKHRMSGRWEPKEFYGQAGCLHSSYYR